VAGYSAIVTGILLVILRYTMGLRVQPRHEYEGLDMALHGQKLEK